MLKRLPSTFKRKSSFISQQASEAQHIDALQSVSNEVTQAGENRFGKNFTALVGPDSPADIERYLSEYKERYLKEREEIEKQKREGTFKPFSHMSEEAIKRDQLRAKDNGLPEGWLMAEDGNEIASPSDDLHFNRLIDALAHCGDKQAIKQLKKETILAMKHGFSNEWKARIVNGEMEFESEFFVGSLEEAKEEMRLRLEGGEEEEEEEEFLDNNDTKILPPPPTTTKSRKSNM